MNRDVFFIGDSHTAFFSGSNKNVYNVKQYQIGNYEDTIDSRKVYFGWQHSRAAYNVDKDLLKEIISPYYEKINDKSFIVFAFGGMDVRFHLKKYKNCKDVVYSYADVCVEFANELNAGFIFMETWYTNNDIEEYTEFNQYLKEYCLEKKLYSPIKIINNIVEYNYKSEDFYNHMGKKDSKKVLEYSLETIKRIEEENA
jgi:hypothetical protein